MLNWLKYANTDIIILDCVCNCYLKSPLATYWIQGYCWSSGCTLLLWGREDKKSFPCRNQHWITYWMLKVKFCRESFDRKAQLKKSMSSFVHFLKRMNSCKEHIYWWVWGLEARGWSGQGEWVVFIMMLVKLIVNCAQRGFNGVCGFHSYHPFLPIHEDSCNHYT